jgi:glucokinase
MMIGAVDIGGTKIAVGQVDGNGRLLSRVESSTDADRGYEHALLRIEEMLRETAKGAGGEMKGVGIGCTGPVYPLSGEIGDVEFLPGWQGKNLVADLNRILGTSVAMENDADAVAIGEALCGAGQGKKSLIFVTVGTGIGGGIILNGQLYRGVDYSHPEIGHHVIDASGPQCYCGARGCWEVLARGPAMVEWFATQTANELGVEPLTAKTICELAQQGHEVALRTVQREARYLGLGLANLITLFTPEVIVLGGSVMKSLPLFWDGIWKTIAANCSQVPFEKTILASASLGADAPLIGAAQVWHHRFRGYGRTA